MEVILIKKALSASDNNKSKAARLLNISWQALDRRMKKLNIDPEAEGGEEDS
jgi:transcriptional regulator with PAS, ATPase and Fis domain